VSQTTENNDGPYFFLITERYVLGTPKGMTASDRTMDIPFHNLANNYDLQAKLQLGSMVFLRPAWRPPLAYPMRGRELVENTAIFLAAFCEDQTEREQRKTYLVNNGLVRILITDDVLREEVRKAA